MLPKATVFSLGPGNNFEVTAEAKAAFDEFGFIVVRGLLTSEELTSLKTALETDKEVLGHSYGLDDHQGRLTKVSIWTTPGNDFPSLISRSEKVAGTYEKLLGGEMYHFSSKLIQKDAFEGGCHVWHQDYGYWYHDGCLWPNMGTVFIPIDRATKENGCLRVLPKSHHAGRIHHHLVGEQAGADLERVEFLRTALGEEEAVEMEAGDALFFHCNVLHTSAQNHSPHRRWAFLVAYNRADNDPVIEHSNLGYKKLDKIRNEEILELAAKLPNSPKKERNFFQGVSEDVSLKTLGEKE